MNVKANSLDKIIANGYCIGCGICAGLIGANKIKMSLSGQGNMRPISVAVFDSDEMEIIYKVCPGIRMEHFKTLQNLHPIWGPIKIVRTGYATDTDIRREGSSGGVISALAVYLIESGQVDFVAQIAVSPSSPLTNELQLSRSRADVLHAAGSRYAPSAPLARLEELLASGQRFALVGKPCDVAAVRRWGQYDERVGKQVRYLISFMCAGVPSINGTHEVLASLGVSSDELASFRYRGDGWPGKARATTKDGRIAEMDYATSWGSILNRHLQFRCKICPDGTGEFADVVCADAWYGKDGYPDFEERDGRSLILSRTPAGESLVSQAVRAGVISVSGLALEEVDRMQPYQRNRKQMVLGRLIGTRLRRGFAPSFWRMGLVRASLSAKPMDWLRNAWGTFKRAVGESQ